MNTNIFILLTFWKTLKLVEGYIKTQTNFFKICFRISTKKYKKEIPFEKKNDIFCCFVFLHVKTKKKHTKTY